MRLRIHSYFVCAQQHQNAAAKAFQLGDWETAVREYGQAIALDAATPAHYSNRSAAYVKLGKLYEAVKDADECIRLAPSYGRGYGCKGSALIAMKLYPQAIQAYSRGLLVAPDEESLHMGLEAARFAQREHCATTNALCRTRAARQVQHKAIHATTATTFVRETRRQIKLEMAALQTQLDLLDELEAMPDDDKVEMLFSLIDQKSDNLVDASELASVLRHGNKSLSLSGAIDRAIRTVAAFDDDRDTKLDLTEFKNSCLSLH